MSQRNTVVAPALNAMARTQILRLCIIFAVCVVGMFATHLLFDHSVLDFIGYLQAVSDEWPAVAAIVVLGLMLDVLLPVPSSVLSVWSVVALGPFAGFAVIWAGMCMACLFGYWFGARASDSLLKNLIDTRHVKISRRLDSQHGAMALVLLRAVPVLAEVSVLTAGALRMPFAHFLRVTALSNAGIALLYAGIGDSLHVQGSFAGAVVASVTVPAIGWGMLMLGSRLRERRAAEALPAVTIESSFSVRFSYPVYFTRQVFSVSNRTLLDVLRPDDAIQRNPQQGVFFVVERDITEAKPGLAGEIAEYCRAHNLNCREILVLEGGEPVKGQPCIDLMQQRMLAGGLDRHSDVVAIGGGALLDAAGYAAATFHRGVRIVRMPTTVLAQNDAGIGVKNGINAHGIKNLLGCFSVPHAVINDSDFLASLPMRVFRSGFAEAVKVGLIRDAAFFDWIEANADLLVRRDERATLQLIKRCAELHIRQIAQGGDPFETGSARPLDYGHWSAHKLELLSKHQLLHGEAVAIGMVLDAFYAAGIGMLGNAEVERIIRLLERLGFDLWHPALQAKDADGGVAVLAGLEDFRQHLGGELCVTLLADIGRGVEVNSVDMNAMLAAREALASRCGHGTAASTVVYETDPTV